MTATKERRPPRCGSSLSRQARAESENRDLELASDWVRWQPDGLLSTKNWLCLSIFAFEAHWDVVVSGFASSVVPDARGHLRCWGSAAVEKKGLRVEARVVNVNSETRSLRPCAFKGLARSGQLRNCRDRLWVRRGRDSYRVASGRTGAPFPKSPDWEKDVS